MMRSFISSFRCAARAARPGTRSITSITRLKRSVWFRIASSSGVLMLPCLLVAAHVDVVVVVELVGELVDQPRVAVEVEDHRLVEREQAVEVAVRRAVRMLAGALHPEEIDHIDEAQLEVRQALAQDRRRRQRLLGRDVAAGCHDHVGLGALVVAGPSPDADALGAMHDRLVDRGELQVLLLVGDDDVDAVG